MNHTFCLRSNIHVSLGMWSLFSLLQTWARCFPVVQIYARYLNFSFSFFTSLPLSLFLPSFFLSPSHFFSFSLGVFAYAALPKQKGFARFCRRVGKVVACVENSTVHSKALHSTVLSRDCFQVSASKCPLNAIALPKEYLMFCELQIGLPERDLACRES